jgi:hypothetical protein
VRIEPIAAEPEAEAPAHESGPILRRSMADRELADVKGKVCAND